MSQTNYNFSLVLMLTIGVLSCKNDTDRIQEQFQTRDVPGKIPIEFKNELITDQSLIHKGIFNPGLTAYYYTLSDKNFQNFDIYVVRKINGIWSDQEKAFFNTDYDEHGMSFSPDGNTIYFSSTRPVRVEGVSDTWHIWKSDSVGGVWSDPEFVDIPNLRNKLMSHPTITNSGMLYFHSSNLDYSEMDIYRSRNDNGTFSDAEKVSISGAPNTGKCTPFISPKGDYLIFATIGNQLDLMVSFSDGQDKWTNTKGLSNEINNQGQGNPFVTPDHKFLFFTAGNHKEKIWSIKWVNIESELNY